MASLLDSLPPSMKVLGSVGMILGGCMYNNYCLELIIRYLPLFHLPLFYHLFPNAESVPQFLCHVGTNFFLERTRLQDHC